MFSTYSSYRCNRQTRALENLSAVLVAAGSGLDHILKANVYLANMPRDFGTMNEAYIKVSWRVHTPALFPTHLALPILLSGIAPRTCVPLVHIPPYHSPRAMRHFCSTQSCRSFSSHSIPSFVLRHNLDTPRLTHCPKLYATRWRFWI